MTEPIPAWALEKAREVWFGHMGFANDRHCQVIHIARALFAERERCAKIVENYGHKSPAMDRVNAKIGGQIHGRAEGEKFAAIGIAAAIRNQEPER